MAVFKCKMCGGALNVQEGSKIVECEYCGTRQTLPRLDNDKTSGLFERANDLRRQNEFDKAEGLYEQILEIDNTDAEVYWSLVLCKYGIEYVEESDTGKRIPTVHRTQFTSVFADNNFKKALEYADDEQREIYNSEAKRIEQIQQDIIRISSAEEPFDIFICYKESDENGERTEDSVIAFELYQQLTKNGYKVFFARVTLESKLGTAYEPYIFSALNSARIMIVIGTKPEHFNAVWVKNEWSRFLKLMKDDRSKTLIPAYKNMSPYNLPKEFAYLQAQDMSKLGFLQDLIAGIEKIMKASFDSKPVNKVSDEIKSKSKLNKTQKIIISSVVGALVVVGVLLAVLLPKFNGSKSVASSSSAAGSKTTTSARSKTSKNEASTDKTENIVEPTDADWEDLQYFLFNLICTNTYDCEYTEAGVVLQSLYCLGNFPMYDYIFGNRSFEDGNYYFDETNQDPKQIFNDGFCKVPAEDFYWILENVMNVKAKKITVIEYENAVVAYEQDGYYYYSPVACGLEYSYSLDDVSKKQLSNGMYEISSPVSGSGMGDDYSEYVGTLTAIIAAKEVDGKHFWSIYKLNMEYDNSSYGSDYYSSDDEYQINADDYALNG